MPSHQDTTAIQRLIGRARLRIRTQWALEGATTAAILAAAAALASIFAIRMEWVTTTTGIIMLVGAGTIMLGGAVIGALRPLDDEVVARRIDRASNLADRLSTAIAFRRSLATAGQAPTADDETTDMMIAAIRDGVNAVPRANVRAATPFAAPKDLRAAAAFLAVSALAAGLALPTVDRSAKLFRADPDHAPPGAEVILHGEHLMNGVAAPVASRLPAGTVLGAPNVPADATAPAAEPGFVPQGASVFLGQADKARPVVVLDWTHAQIRIRIPADAPIGETVLTAHVGNKTIGPVMFTVVDPKDSRYHSADSVQLDPDEKAYVEAILAELKRIAKRDNIEDLDKFAKTIEQLLKDAEEGKITKEQLLEALAKAEELLDQNAEPDPAELAKQLAELSKELEKNKETKDLAKALKENNLEKAKEELEKLADRLDPKTLEEMQKELEKQLQDPNLSEKQKQELQKKLDELKKLAQQKQELEQKLADKNLTEQQRQELQKKLEQLKKQADKLQNKLTEQQKQQLQKTLDNVAKQMEQQQKKQEQKQQQQQQQLEEQVRRLQKEMEQAKTEEQRLSAERRLNKAKQELQKLQKENEQKQKSAQREAVKRLQRDLEKAAESLQKQNPQESQEEQEERERQASQKLKDAARETGRVDQDRRKRATQKKMSSQMDDLREAMRRAKQKGNKGPKDPFGKNAKNKDFQARARGKKGQGQSWRPGQGQGGQGQGQGQGNQPGGQGQGQGGDTWGTGHDPNLTGDPTAKSGNTKDEELQGKHGRRGGSTRETILSAAQKGFASKGYQKVYADYQRIVEEVMRTEKLPSSYKYYVKRYFAKIHPSGASETIEAPQETKDTP